MAASSDDVARLRRMVNEPTAATYTDDDLSAYIERYPCIDDQGLRPFYIDQTTSPPSRTETIGWMPTYDLNYAASDLWAEKAAILSQDYDFSADGGKYDRSQAYEQAMKQSRFYLSRRQPGTIKLSQEPRTADRRDVVYVGNLPEESDD